MTILEMIAEWEKGCSCSMRVTMDGSLHKLAPWVCQTCTEALIEAIKKQELGKLPNENS